MGCGLVYISIYIYILGWLDLWLLKPMSIHIAQGLTMSCMGVC